MARIPVLGVPKGVPVGSGQQPLTEYPIPDLYKRPAIKANYEPIRARVNIPFHEQGINIERHIPGLMQKGVSQATNDALIEGTLAQGRGLGSAAKSVSGAINDLIQGLQNSKNQADLSRSNMIQQTGHAAFEEEAVTNGLTGGAKLELWEKKYQPQIEEQLGSLGMTPYAADREMPKWELFKIKARTEIIHEARVEQMKNDELAITTDLEDAIANGDAERALEANTRLTIAGHQTIEQARKRGMDIGEKLLEHDIQKDMNENPRMVQQEMEEAERDGKSDIYPRLKNPATIAKFKRAARDEVNRREVDVDQEISDKIITGEITTEEHIRREAGGNLSETRIKARVKMLEADPAYSAEAVSTLRTEVQAYNAEGDFDMAKYHALRDKISTTVPKDIQGRLNAELYQTATTARDGKFKTPQQKYQSEVMQRIDALGKQGYFDPPGYDREQAAKDPLAYGEQESRIWTRIETYKESMREWLNKNPDATPEQADKQLTSLIGNDLADGAQGATDPKPPPGLKDILPPAAARQQQGPTSSLLLREPLIDRVKELESFWPTAKWDSGQYSVGYGTKGKKGESLTPEEADARLRQELTTHANNVDRAAKSVGLNLTPGQRDALISFDFNTGRAQFLIESSGGNLSEIRRRMPSWNKEEKGGPISQGLVNRRKAELKMFNS